MVMLLILELLLLAFTTVAVAWLARFKLGVFEENMLLARFGPVALV